MNMVQITTYLHEFLLDLLGELVLSLTMRSEEEEDDDENIEVM